MHFVDVILPLPLEGFFTYAIPDEFVGKVQVGMRVVVPLGRSKTYLAVVSEIHDRKPNFDCKSISGLTDSQPMLLNGQLKLWKWIADYYMSPIGEVYNAAMPAGLKDDDYRPRTEPYITLAPKFRNEQAIHIALDMLRRATAQQKVLVDFLTLSHYDSIEGEICTEPIVEVSRDELMNQSHCTSATLKNLIDRQIFIIYQKEVGRLNQGGEPHPENICKLNTYQQEAYNQILFQFLQKKVVLLHGVTSSGKTEIYIHLIQNHAENRAPGPCHLSLDVLHESPAVPAAFYHKDRAVAFRGDNSAVDYISKRRRVDQYVIIVFAKRGDHMIKITV